MLDALLFVLLLVAALQPTIERAYAGFMFACFAIVHYVLMYNVEGWIYYFSAALLDASIVFFTLKLRVISPVIESLHAICYISILMNFFGWILWHLYLPPDAYNVAFLLVYAWAILNLLRREPGDARGSDTIGMGHRHFSTSPSKSHNSNPREAHQK